MLSERDISMGRRTTGLIAFLLVFCCLFFHGQRVEAPDRQCEFEFTPYMRAAGIDVDTTTVKGREATGEFEFPVIISV